MKAILEFNLPEESEEYKHHSLGPRYYCILSELLLSLRNKIKYENKHEYEQIRQELIDLIAENNVEL